MTTYSCKVRPTHADDTVCAHRYTSSGRPLEPCPGRVGVQATCSCGEELGAYTIRAALEERRAIHLSMHATLDSQGVS